MDQCGSSWHRGRFMAVTNKKSPSAPQPVSLIMEYTPKLQRRMLLTILLPGVLIGLACALLLMTYEVAQPDHPVFWLISIGVTVLSMASNLLLFVYTSSPTDDLLRAIARVSGESSNGPLPNPYDQKYVKNGLSAALQAVYNLDSQQSKRNTAEATTTEGLHTTSSVLHSLDRMKGSLITLDANHTVVYASKASPLHTVDGKLEPQLLFNGRDTLLAWLEECETSAVKAEHYWRRIPDRPADQEDQRIFDVYASYEKGAAHETVLTLVDQTALYQGDEEDLNFIAFAAHELRGPITVIRGYLDVLEDELSDVLEADQRELFLRLTVSANRLSSYINNILNTSRYDRRHLNIALTPDSLAKVYATINDDMMLRASSQNRILSVTIPDDLPEIAAERASLSEVISNLIDNAIKYSNEGGAIAVTAKQKGDFVDIIVEDHGIGMPANVVNNLFQKFYRSHRSRETVAGSGIGLYISKAIVESHGGTISVHSTEGEGSTFTASIPTYASVAEKLADTDNNNQDLITHGKGWIKNHSMYRG